MTEKMSNAPVYYALAQACFNPVAAMGEYINKIQDQLRREGYPLFETHQFTQLFLPESGQAQPRMNRTNSWLIIRDDRTAGFIIDRSSIVYHTTSYQTHKEFISELLHGLDAVNKAVSLAHVSRLALRYLDAVLPRPQETAKQYLAKGLQGIDFKTACRQHMTESIFITDTRPLVQNGRLVVRVYYRPSAPLGFPPDMLPKGLNLVQKFAAVKGEIEHAVIDTDHYVQGQMPLDMGQLEEQMLSLRDAIKSVFTATVTKHALNVWK